MAHLALCAVVIVLQWQAGRNAQDWGGIGAGGAISATLVSPAAIPLPTRRSGNEENVVANEETGVPKTQPQQKAVEQSPEAEAIPERATKTKPAPRSRPQTIAKAQPQPEVPSNAVPYGTGAAANSLPFGIAGGSGTLTIGDPGNNFAGRYGWYVTQVTQKIALTWYQYGGSPNVPKGARVTVSFEIARNGAPSDIYVSQPSGYGLLDNAAQMTLKRIDAFPPLPSDYRGGSVRVNFSFEK
jgi:TonB family protein